MRSKTLKIISHNHIKIKGIKIIGSKTRKHQEHIQTIDQNPFTCVKDSTLISNMVTTMYIIEF